MAGQGKTRRAPIGAEGGGWSRGRWVRRERGAYPERTHGTPSNTAKDTL